MVKELGGSGMIGEGDWDMQTGRRKNDAYMERNTRNAMSGASARKKKEDNGNNDAFSTSRIQNIVQARRLSGTSVKILQYLMCTFLRELVTNSISVSLSEGSKTMTKEDVERALGNMRTGKNTYVNTRSRVETPVSPPCFGKRVRELAHEIAETIRVSKDAIFYLHLVTERYGIKILDGGNDV